MNGETDTNQARNTCAAVLPSDLQADHIQRRRDRSPFYLACLALLLVPALKPLVRTDFTCGYDNVFHLWRAVEAGHLLRHGILFSRWAPNMARGFGYPLFVFHAPISAFLAAALHTTFGTAGLPWAASVNAVFALGIALGGLFAFLLARDLSGAPAGLVASATYIYAPFQAYESFNRGSLSEALAWAFPPLILWALHRYVSRRDHRFLAIGALSLAVMILTHQLFAFLFAPLLVAWVLLASVLARDWRVIGRGAAVGFLGLGLSAFFWLPGLAERAAVQTNRLLGTWVFDFRSNFLTLRELLALPRSVDPSLINDWPPKALGLAPALVALLPLARWRWMNRTARCQTAVLLALLAAYSLMTLPVSLPLWERLPLLPYVQFPWRFLGPATLCTALLAALAVSRSGPPHAAPRWWRAAPASAVLILVIALSNLGWFRPRHCSPPRDTSIAGMIAWERATHTLGTTAKGEYLPVWVQRFPEQDALAAAYEAGESIARLDRDSLPPGTHALQEAYRPLGATVELDSATPFRARYLAFYYPGWRVTVDGASVPVAPTDSEGLVSFEVPAGRHTIQIRFGETHLRLVADAISILSLVALTTLCVLRALPEDRRLRVLSSAWRALRHPVLAVVAVVTLLFLVALALNLSPSLRGPEDWRWVYAIPGRPVRLWIPAVTLVLYLVLAGAWIRRATRIAASRGSARWLLLALVLSVPLIQASLLVVGDSDAFKPLFYRTVSAGSSGVFSVGSTIESIGDYLRQYPALMPSFPVHPQRYPPGLPLLFALARRLLERMPALADALGYRLRLYQCHDLALMRLDNATIGTAAIQMALPLIGGLTLLPLHGLGKLVYGRRTAAWAVAVYPLVSSFALWSARWEQFYPLVATTSWYLLHLSLVRRRWMAALAAGITLSLGSMLNFGLLALLVPMGISAALSLAAQPADIRRFRSAASSLVAFVLGLVSIWVVYRLWFGTGFLDIWRVSMSYHLGLNRSYGLWVVYHLYDFFIFLGIPLALLFVVALAKGLHETLHLIGSWLLRAARLHPQPRPAVDALTMGLASGLLILDLSGTSRGEVARVWLFLTPFAALVAVRGLARLRVGTAGVGVVTLLLALHLFTFNTFLRVVTTGLTDPPFRARHFDLERTLSSVSQPLGATFIVDGTDAIALLGYDLEPQAPHPGDTLQLTLHWQALAPLAGPYTVFTHLVGPDGGLIGQQDNMPLQDAAPTTCWVPGEILADPYGIPTSPQAAAGEYALEVGLYVLQTGERLPVRGPAATGEGSVVLTSIPVVDR